MLLRRARHDRSGRDRRAAEHFRRECANIHSLDESYAIAAQQHLRGVIVIWQADPNFNNEQYLQPGEYDDFADIGSALHAT